MSAKQSQLTADQEQIVAEIARRIAERSDRRKTHIQNRVRARLHELIHLIPLMHEFYNRPKNREHAKKLSKAIDTLKQLLATVPPGLNAALSENCPDTSWRHDLDAQLSKLDTQLTLLQPSRLLLKLGWQKCELGHDPRFDETANWCALGAAELLKELAPHARISSSGPDSLFRRVTGLLCGAVEKLDFDRAFAVDVERACDRIVREINKDRKGTGRQTGTDKPQ
jgi:hypothetical protein